MNVRLKRIFKAFLLEKKNGKKISQLGVEDSVPHLDVAAFRCLQPV